MNMEELRDYCLQKRGVMEGFPFGEDTIVYKVGEKMFLLANLEEGNRFNAKCDPGRAVELRELHEEVKPGYHMNKKHWNTVHIDGRMSLMQLQEIIDHSYELVFSSLPQKAQAAILAQPGS